MDIAPISVAMNQFKVQKLDYIPVMKTISETEKDNADQIIKKTQSISIDPEQGQILDVKARQKLDEKEELGRQLQKELKWAQNKQKMLNVKEVKLLQMREIEQQGKQLTSLNPQEQKKLDDRLNNLAAQISLIDSDSRRTKDGSKLE